ncbi:MAG: lytic murein transglycosylase, partial [Pseudomonadota bacterium]
IESDFGQFKGDFYTPHALANLVCAGKRRQKYFRGELIKTLQIASRGDVPVNDFQGSWAGAFGQTQFMPSTYNSLAVDFDGDGRKDLVNSVPDALASTANFLKNAGWRDSRAWGYEVKVPSGYSGPTGLKKRAALSTWGQRGFKRVGGGSVSGKTEAALIRPAGANGPAFLVTRNFNALRSYNASTSYGLAIALLSELVADGEPFKTPWPTDNPGLSRAQRLELQKLLNRNGFNVGEPDGKVGPLTRAGIRKAEAKYGLPVTGRPSWNVYSALGGK